MNLKNFIVLTVMLFIWAAELESCTIFSARDQNGHTWAGNNEDFVFTFDTYLNIAAHTDSSLGYIFFTYFSRDEVLQGGINEAGLFFDFNAIPESEYKDYDKKKDFPGGTEALMRYILSSCKTVKEVFKLYEIYRDPDIRSAQMHLADKSGNLGIIVADSMWITQEDFQVSTNYNLCHKNKDGQMCWRFPIAERILLSEEPGLETFRMICDSTHQRNVVNTIYSNIHNLTTGDIWFYYGMDYKKAYKTNIHDLVIMGDTSILMYEFFRNEPLFSVYNTYLSEGAEKSLEKLDKYNFTEERNNEILQMLSSDLIVTRCDFNAYPFLNVWIKTQKEVRAFFHVTNAIVLYSTNRKKEALEVLSAYLSQKPENTLSKRYYERMQGIFGEGMNVHFKLCGYKDAKYVFIDKVPINGITDFKLFNFLIKEGDQWVGEFNLPPGENYYIFFVDGKRVFDPNNSIIEKKNGLEYNKINIKE